jgi:hypothetical protein
MSLFDSASLCITPNAYKEDKLYSIKPTDGSGDLVVTRATTATRVNSAGLVEIVPYNLVTYSEQFDNADWGKENSSITANQLISPDGNLSADIITDNSTNDRHIIYQSFTGDFSTARTFSTYAKQDSLRYLVLSITSVNDSSASFSAIFDLQTGTITATKNNGTATINASIQNAGNGWYRCIISGTLGTGILAYFPIIGTSNRATFTGALANNNIPVYVGSGQSLYIWGGQLVTGTSAKEYFPTTDRLNVPRIDYTNGSCPSILVEPQRTNLTLYSEQFDNAAWDKFGTALTVTSNNVISPDGTQNADTLNVSNNNNTLYQVRTGTFVGNTYTFSIYAKGSGTFVMNGRLNSVTTTTSTKTLTSQWQRFDVTVTNAAPVIAIEFFLELNTSSTYNIWGAQVEAGAYATSYIPTVASSVTRNADVISKTGISSLIGQTEGTVFWDIYVETPTATDNENILNIDNGSFGNTIYILKGGGATISAEMYSGGSAQASFSKSSIVKGRYKCAIAYANNNTAFFVNGVQVGSTDTSCTVPATSRFQMGVGALGASTGFINSSQLYKTRLTNAECIALTTL